MRETQKTTGVLFAGVGGQGIILASELLAAAALEAGLDVKKSEVHGMAQRGGSVVSHVRFGEKVFSPLIPEGEADCLAAFEEMEGLRHLHHLRKGGVLVINRQRIYTLSMLTGGETYPAEPREAVRGLPLEVVEVDGARLAREAGNAKAANVAVLGALAARLPFETQLWERVLSRLLPRKVVEVNLEAFRRGVSGG